MTHLDELERSILANARAAIEPVAEDQSRIFARLVADLGLNGAVTVSHSAPRRPTFADRARQWARSRTALAASTAILGAGAGYALGYRAGSATVPVSPAAPTASILATTARQPDLPALPVVPAAARQTVAPIDAASENVPQRRPTSSARIGNPVPSAAGSTTETSADPIAEELALLKRAERAIRASNPLLALGLLGELDQRFPKGRLLDERAAARVMANCENSDPKTARGMGESYLQKAQNGLYRERVRQLCGLSNANVKGSETTGD